MLKTLVIIPTYNEAENIAGLTKAIFELSLGVDILVVDDNSPDGTADQVLELQLNYLNLHLLRRDKKDGLGRAYLAGFAWAREHGFEAVVQMDADFSHSPKYLPAILQALETNDFVIGSRYTKGGGVVNWPLTRQIISRGGGLYARLILGLKIKDLTGGFNAWRLTTLDKIKLVTVDSNGYSFQIELKAKATQAGCTHQEVPIIFEERRLGQSKLKGQIITEAIWRVWQIKWKMINKKTLLVLSTILLLTAAVYQSVFTSSFLKVWDDQTQVIANPDITTLTLTNLKTIASSFYIGMYQPLSTFSYALEYHWFGLNPLIFHSTNLLLHLINILLVYCLAKNILKKSWPALAVTAIFALHPLQVEAVTWVSARSTLLCSTWLLLGTLTYWRYSVKQQKADWWKSLIIFILAVLSKSLAIVFPLIILLIDWYHHRLNKKTLIAKIPFFVLSLWFGFIAINGRVIAGHNKTAGYAFYWWEKLASATYALWLYLFKIILPINLAPYYAWPRKINGYLPWFYWLPLIFFILLLVPVIIKHKQITRLTCLAWGWFGLNVILMLNFVKFSPQIIAERYTYLALVGTSIFLISLSTQFLKTYPKIKPLIIVSFIAYLAMFMFIGWRQTAIWHNNDKFLNALISANVTIPGHYILRARYTMEKNPNSEEALTDTTMALLLRPNYIEAHQVRSQLFFNRREFTSALAENDWLIKALPDDPGNYFDQGIIWLNIGDTNKACSVWKQGLAFGLKLNPEFKKLCPKI